MTLGPDSFRHRPAKAANGNVSAARLELISWVTAIGFMWATVLVPVAAILWGAP